MPPSKRRWIKYYGHGEAELVHARLVSVDPDVLVPCLTPLPASCCTCGAWELIERPPIVEEVVSD